MRKLPKKVASYKHALKSVLLEDKMPGAVISDLNQALSGVNGGELVRSSLHEINRDLQKSNSNQLVNRRYSVSESDVTDSLLSIIDQTFSNEEVVRQLKRKKQLAITSAVKNHLDVEFSWRKWFNFRASGPGFYVFGTVSLLCVIILALFGYEILNSSDGNSVTANCDKKDELIQVIELQMQQADQFKDFLDGKLGAGVDSIHGVDIEKARRDVSHYSEEIRGINITLNSVPNSCDRSFVRSKKSESSNIFKKIERLKNKVN